MDPTPDEEDEDENLKDEQKGLIIILGSLVVISTIVVIGIFIFFPFNSQIGPAIVIEKNSPIGADSDNPLEKNDFLLGINQDSPYSRKTKRNEKTGSEEFFLEILPDSQKISPSDSNKPTPVTEPIHSSSPAPSANLFDSLANAPAPEHKVPAVVSLPENAPAPTPKNSASVAAPKASSKSKAKSAPVTPKGPSFWLQIGSYSDEKLANSVIEKLKKEGFEAKKIKFNDGSRTLNRVRMGPYANKSEANKFLSWIQDLPNFKESYILQTNN